MKVIQIRLNDVEQQMLKVIQKEKAFPRDVSSSIRRLIAHCYDNSQG